MTTISPQSRITVSDIPTLAPGICCLCGSAGGDGRRFIDFGKQLDWYGAVYFCSYCIAEVVTAIDYVSVSKFNEIYLKYRELQVQIDQLKAKYSPFEEAIKNVVDSPTPNFGMVLHPSHVRDSDNEVRESDEPSVEESAHGESKTDKPVDVEGPDDLFDASDFVE